MNSIAEPWVDVVICTYNRAVYLERALQALADQSAPRDGRWRVLVVDNNCTDGTQAVVERFRSSGRVPGLRTVGEPRQGLVPARQRGFTDTSAPWVAFVDDDCLVEPDWIANVLVFTAAHTDVAGFNGCNALDFELDADPEVHRPEWYAGSNPADTAVRRKSLHGAGMVLNRASVERSGWIDQPLAPDRSGRSLVSGGDNELSLRARAGGGDLWFVPSCRLRHRIGADRMRVPYVARLAYRLAESEPLLAALVWERSRGRLGIGLAATAVRRSAGAARHLVSAAGSCLAGGSWRGAIIDACYDAGVVIGVLRLAVTPRSALAELVGMATPARVERLEAVRSALDPPRNGERAPAARSR